MSELDDNAPARGQSSNSSPADVCTLGSSTGITSQCTTSHKPGNSGEKKGSENADAAEEADQLAEPALCCIHGINQVVLVIQPDDSTQYMLLSEEKALREAAAKQAALEAAEQGLVRFSHVVQNVGAVLLASLSAVGAVLLGSFLRWTMHSRYRRGTA